MFSIRTNRQRHFTYPRIIPWSITYWTFLPAHNTTSFHLGPSGCGHSDSGDLNLSDKLQPHSEQQPQPKNPATPPFESPREEALIISGSPQPLNCSVKPQQTMISAIRLTPPDSLQQPQKTKISPPQSTHMSISQPQNETQVQQTTSQRQTAVLPAPSIGLNIQSQPPTFLSTELTKS